MSAQRHVIKRQVIELTVQRPEDAQAYQDTLSRIYRQRIVPWMERHFDELSGPDRLWRIDTLDLDIGILDPETLEEDFVSRVEAFLTAELASRIETEETSSERSANPSSLRGQLELFALFVRGGSLPWWADASQPRILTENLAQLLIQSPKALGALLPELLREPDLRLRLINNYPDDQLGALCALLVPAYGAELQRDLSALLERLQNIQKTADGRKAARLRKALWHALLWVAGMGGRQYASLADFYRAVIRRLDPELSRMLLDALRRAGLGRKAGAEASETRHSAAQEVDLAERVGLEADGKLPGHAGPTVQADPPAGLPGEGFLTELLRSAQARTGAAPSQPASRRTRSDRASSKTRPPGQESSTPQKTKPPDVEDKKALDLSFSESDEILVRNSGLVILWPFLGNLFTRLGLMDEDRQFRDNAARQRAAGLLQVLATQEAAPPEYLLPLNKILCGLALTDIFDFGPALRENEAQECAHLLEAVITQVPILNNMSADGLRGSFLLRSGILSVRDGMWLLRVERQTYDIILGRFPWGWEWVRLSWMEAPMRVEW